MSDEKLRDLERRAKLGEDVRVQLLAEQQRLGLRKAFPPRTKAYKHLRPFLGWCPACREWSLRRTEQKLRSRRKGKHRLPRRVCITTYLDRIYETCPFRAVPVGETFTCSTGGLWTKVDRLHATGAGESGGARKTAFEPERQVGYRPAGCPGPARGQSCRPPLEVLEARIRELEDLSAGTHDSREIAWCRWRIRKTPGVKFPEFDVLSETGRTSSRCRHSRLDYEAVDGVVNRLHVVCQDCDAVLDPDDGRVLVEGMPRREDMTHTEPHRQGEGSSITYFQDYRPLNIQNIPPPRDP